MPGVVYVVAQAPWGPIRIKTAPSMGHMLGQITTQPAHIEDVGNLDAVQVAAAAAGLLATADEAGWIKASVAEATRRLAEARQAVSARVIAGDLQNAAPAPPESHGEASAIAKHPAAAMERASPVRPFTDVKAIRQELGMSQDRFARSFGVSLATIQDWEQGRSRPDQTARAFLRVIAMRPDVVREVLAQAV